MNVWRERLGRWFSPLAQRCPLSPNAITILALLLNLAAAYLLYRRFFLIAMVILIVGGVADAFDGIVARVQNKSSRFGDFLDHVCDRVSDTLLITGWLLGNGVWLPLTIASIIAVMLNGYIGTQIEATWGTRSYDSMGRGEFVLALVVYPIGSHILFANGWAAMHIQDWMTGLLLAVAFLGITQRFAVAIRAERS
ncbi:MAG TPA: CDP-alcohol phosphatidyltransferase family protein [Thermoanaerobaculia bacterium]|jgi:phosphatidylglycerophosphate synthase|nr:CDP-alcohol phosphatidyltransferase family protein [Thermoanaerobaculia bacterium]